MPNEAGAEPAGRPPSVLRVAVPLPRQRSGPAENLARSP